MDFLPDLLGEGTSLNKFLSLMSTITWTITGSTGPLRAPAKHRPFRHRRPSIDCQAPGTIQEASQRVRAGDGPDVDAAVSREYHANTGFEREAGSNPGWF